MILKPYDNNYPDIFNKEIKRLQKNTNFLNIFHVGSTSIPGLIGKGIIDILWTVNDITKPISFDGYKESSPLKFPFHRYFSNDFFHIHVLQDHDPHIYRFLKFRDYLISHEEDKNEYAKLKIQLASSAIDKFQDYTLKKHLFVKNIIKKSGFDGLVFSSIVSPIELEEFNKLKQKETTVESSEEKKSQHFLLYKGAEIVTISSIEMDDNYRAIIKYLITDKKYRMNGYGIYTLQMLERFLRCHNIKTIMIDKDIKNADFFIKHQYKINNNYLYKSLN